jgi:Nucleotidyl transferase AbiEii toxin, Type IV TA system
MPIRASREVRWPGCRYDAGCIPAFTPAPGLLTSGQAVEDDGLVFDPKSLRVNRIKEDQEYEGLRVNFVARLERARIHMQVDVGFGDVIVPPPTEVRYPAMLDFPSPRLRTYPRETVVAEKLEALAKLGIANTRMKDFYDLWRLSHDFDFDGALLTDAFKRRGTEVPSGTPFALTDEFSRNSQKTKQWEAFMKKSGLDHDQASLHTVAVDLTRFLIAPLRAGSFPLRSSMTATDFAALPAAGVAPSNPTGSSDSFIICPWRKLK